MTRWRARALQLIGILTATIGLAGFWLTIGSTRTVLSEVDLALTNPTGEPFQASFVVAGRDIDWAIPARNPIYNSRGEITGFRTPARGKSYSGRTDSIFYVHVVGDTLHLIAIPRDIWLDHKGMRINAVMGRAGADGLRQAVSDLLGLPVDYHVIVNIEIFQRVIDALGGVTIEVPRRMYYADTAASLLIDLHPGVQHMDGADVANFVRFRSGGGDDLGRIDNLKRLASALLQRL